jgi:hypothetical protein
MNSPSGPKRNRPHTEKERAAIRMRAANDMGVNLGVGQVNQAYYEFESGIVADRLALIGAFHEVRWCGVELTGLRKARAHDKREPGRPESPERRIRNEAVTDSHVTALESRRAAAATTLLVTLDRLFDAVWMKLGLPEWSVRGGPIIGARDVTAFELIHLCGNYLRHVHEWLAGSTNKSQASGNIERLRTAGFDYRDDALLARVVDALPFENFINLEITALDFVEFISWFTQERMVRNWAAANGEPPYQFRFNPDDAGNGNRKVALDLDRDAGKKWLFPPS